MFNYKLLLIMDNVLARIAFFSQDNLTAAIAATCKNCSTLTYELRRAQYGYWAHGCNESSRRLLAIRDDQWVLLQ